MAANAHHLDCHPLDLSKELPPRVLHHPVWLDALQGLRQTLLLRRALQGLRQTLLLKRAQQHWRLYDPCVPRPPGYELLG